MAGPSSRALALLSLLQTRRDWSAAILAERLGVATRTVRRDIDRLRELGYRVQTVKGPYGGYRLEAGSELPPLLFDDEQAVAIAVALQNAGASGVDIGEAAERALATVRQVMPQRLRHRIDRVRFIGQGSGQSSGEGSGEGGGRSAGSGDDTPVDPSVLEAVSDAVRDRVTLRFDYGVAEEPPRRTQPHGLVPRQGRWYLVAWDLDRDDWRIFRLDRMHPRVPTGPRFTTREIPGGDAGSFVEARAKGAWDENRWPCVGEFEIDLPTRDVSPWIRDGEVVSTGDSSCRVIAGSWSWTGLVASVLRFDAPFRIVGPVEFADAASQLGLRLRAAQSTDDG